MSAKSLQYNLNKTISSTFNMKIAQHQMLRYANPKVQLIDPKKIHLNSPAPTQASSPHHHSNTLKKNSDHDRVEDIESTDLKGPRIKIASRPSPQTHHRDVSSCHQSIPSTPKNAARLTKAKQQTSCRTNSHHSSSHSPEPPPSSPKTPLPPDQSRPCQ